MKRNLRYLMVLSIITISLLDVSCPKDSSDDKINVTTDTTRTFNMEYDHMESYDVFNGVGQDRVKNAFEPAKTNLNIAWSNWIDDQVWDYRYLDSLYVTTYADRTNGLFDHKCYLLAMGEVIHLPVPDIGGATRDDGIQGKVRSFIFVYNIRQHFPDYEEMVHKVVIHELGHARASLTHLCIFDNTMSPDHDFEDCVMAEGRYATCTGYDVTVYLHFCNKCINEIQAVKW